MSTTSNNQPDKDFWKTQSYTPSKHKGSSKVKITIPSCENFTLFKMAEISAPGGATIVVKLPFPMAEAGLSKMGEAIKTSGGTLELID